MAQPLPPKAADGQPTPPDPSIPYKDAAFAMLSHEPPLVGDDKSKSDLTAALTAWVQTDFEDRIDNSSQQFGVEQIMRFLGPTAVKALPATITEASSKNDKACQLLADIGDDDTTTAAGVALVAMAKSIDSAAWLDKQRALVTAANAKTGQPTLRRNSSPTSSSSIRSRSSEKVFVNMKRVGRAARHRLLPRLRDRQDEEREDADRRAGGAFENRVDKNVLGDANALFTILADDTAPGRRTRRGDVSASASSRRR